MNIELTYEPTVDELTKASSLFIEKKPFLKVAVMVMNVVAIILILLTIAKFWLLSLTAQDASTVIIALLWIFGRKPFNEWLLRRKMKKSLVVNKPITIALSNNGIVWKGETLKSGNLNWAHVAYLIEAKNGFILPYSGTKFLWIPFRAFKDNHAAEDIRSFLNERHITLRRFPKWAC